MERQGEDEEYNNALLQALWTMDWKLCGSLFNDPLTFNTCRRVQILYLDGKMVQRDDVSGKYSFVCVCVCVCVTVDGSHSFDFD